MFEVRYRGVYKAFIEFRGRNSPKRIYVFRQRKAELQIYENYKYFHSPSNGTNGRTTFPYYKNKPINPL